MDRIRNNSKNRFILMLLVAALLFTGVFSIFAFKNRERITNQNRDYLYDKAEYVGESIDMAISDGYSNIRILSELVSSSLTGPEFDISSIQELINNSVFDFMEFADKDGMDHNITGSVSDARDRKYYLDAKDGNIGMELIYHSRATHETLLMFYAPIYYDGEFVGSLVGVYQASNRITRLLKNKYFGEDATSYLATDKGRIIASSKGLDSRFDISIEDIAVQDPALKVELKAAVDRGEGINFTSKGNETGGCMIKLSNGWYVIQIFPQEASDKMTRNANRLAAYLVAVLVLINLTILFLVINFYIKQQKIVENAREEAEQANDAKTRFLFNMSHDIRTPMNAILGYTDIALRHNDDSERVDDSLKKIKISGEHLLNLINDILEMSRIESGKLVISEKPVKLTEIIDNIGEMSQALANSKSISFSATIGELKDKYILSDELHINEVLINLISNAIKYTKEGGKVEFRTEQISDIINGTAEYRFVVKDTGIGMSDEFQKHLFEAFAREETTFVSKEEGAGLGLSIVKRIVDAAGGKILVESKLNEGSTFTVELPFKVMDEQSIKEYEESHKKGEGLNDSLLKNMRVLLVEDNEMNREIANDLLSEVGIMIETAEDGSVALDKVKEKGTSYYDFILMDIQMPVMNGFEATRAIRKLPDGNRVPIIALSANAFTEDIQKSVETGMNAHVPKPIDVEILLQTIHKVLENRG